MSMKQWVNLYKYDEFVDNEVTSKDRCGKFAIDIEVEKADKSMPYKLIVEPVIKGDAIYNKKERKRNSKFRETKGKVGIIDDKTIRVSDLQLPAVGGETYKVKVMGASDTEVFSDEIETMRKLYYQVITMDAGKGDTETTVKSYSLKDRETDLEEYYIKLEKKGDEQKMKFITNVGDDNAGEFYSEVIKAYTLPKRIQKKAFAAVFSNYLADMGEETIFETVNIGTKNPMCTWDDAYVTLRGDVGDLWYGLNDFHDKLNWYLREDVRVTYKALNGASQVITISKFDVKPANKETAYGAYTGLKIPITGELKKLLNKVGGTLEFEAEVNIVEGWTAGFRVNVDGVEIVTVARRCFFEDVKASELPCTWNHEIGHRLGMVAYGNKDYRSTNTDFEYRPWTPDAPQWIYGEDRGVNDQGHAGPHCSNGTDYDKETGKWTGTPLCVMYGADMTDTGGKQPEHFCDDCKKLVRKLDLSLPPTR